MLICQWFYAIPVALPFEAQNFSPSMKIGTYKKKTLKIDHQVLKKSLTSAEGLNLSGVIGFFPSESGNHRLHRANLAAPL